MKKIIEPKKVIVLGSTGSIGVNALEVIRRHPGFFKIVGLAARCHVELLLKQIREFAPQAVYLKDPGCARELSRASLGAVKIFSKEEGLQVFTTSLKADVLVAATSGIEALGSVIEFLERGGRVALANKEVLVAAGGMVMAALKRSVNASLVPVDSEHSAIFQCLGGLGGEHVRRIILTGSGGPLRTLDARRFSRLKKEIVINHPKWKMGKKISVDSATLMNKGLELIEASWLFGLPIRDIDVWIHPEAVIHSMVEFRDGAILAQLGVTDMKLPIQYALSFPARYDSLCSMRLKIEDLSKLTFALPDRRKFPCLDMAYEAATKQGTAPCVLSAADEVAVEAFLGDKINFGDIPKIIEKTLSRHRVVAEPGLGDIAGAHDWAVCRAEELCGIC